MSESAENINSDNIKIKRRPLGLFLLPFVYFYLLSFTLIGVSAYMLLENPIGATSSFASEIENPGNEDFKIILTKKNPETQKQVFECRKEIANKIDKFFTEGSNPNRPYSEPLPLAGHGCDFDIHGQENNVDPILVASIAFIESTGGKRTPKYEGIESYNPFGYGVYDNTALTKELDHHLCQDFNDCIGRVTRAIRRNASERNITTNPEDVVTWYNPGSVVRAGGVIENSSWYKNITSTMIKINAMPLSENNLAL